jgi:hypothetical protein
MASTPACPRCGYDQTGVIASWEQAEPLVCPLDGVCSECGLEFPWVDVMRPERQRIAGLYEHAQGPGQSLGWALRTLVLAGWPRRFWSVVPLAARPILERIAAWPWVATLMVWAAGSVAATIAALPRMFVPA